MSTKLDARDAAGFGAAFTQEVWLLGMSHRWLYLIIGPIAFLMLALLHFPNMQGMIGLMALIAVAASAFWPVMVWYNEGPSRRAYHWSLPVARGSHEMARVFAGAVWLLAVCGVLAAIGLLTDFANGTIVNASSEIAEMLYGPKAWLYFFASPVVLYFLVMPLTLWSEYRITRVLLGSWIAYVVVALWAQSMGFHQLAHAIDFVFGSEGWSLGDVLIPGIDTAGSMSALAFWLAIGVALSAATAWFRPDDIRRRFSRSRP